MEFFLRQVYPWLANVSMVSPLIPFIAGFFLFRSKKSLQFKLLFLFVTLIVASEAAGKITILLGTKNNIWLLHIYTALEYLLLAAIYYYSFKSSLIKKGIIASVVVLLVFSIVDATLIDGVHLMNSTAKMAANSMLIVLAVLYFYKVANDLTITYLDSDAIFLLSCGVLIYKAGTSMSFALFNQALAQSYDAARICITVLLVLNILFNTALVFVLRKTSVC
ncbi:hypothetical protein H8S95_11420 [Pontibacter sp. KCTC 32443]|uniref:hypothetical protein n=1 Tax=Pontibacter TaxID=323449 RepID=UPI00164D0068|nr:MULTISPECIES: hypothetical protein [Pontibacter]MBC5774673.1 hypothetical protein [Pontibacter sp. KCTC 32443]